VAAIITTTIQTGMFGGAATAVSTAPEYWSVSALEK
jgi:hypothetical protein